MCVKLNLSLDNCTLLLLFVLNLTHPHMSSGLVLVAGRPMGIGSGSPPVPPHSRTDSEPVSTSWNLHSAKAT